VKDIENEESESDNREGELGGCGVDKRGGELVLETEAMKRPVRGLQGRWICRDARVLRRLVIRR
jgi:hypothetical protein